MKHLATSDEYKGWVATACGILVDPLWEEARTEAGEAGDVVLGLKTILESPEICRSCAQSIRQMLDILLKDGVVA